LQISQSEQESVVKLNFLEIYIVSHAECLIGLRALKKGRCKSITDMYLKEHGGESRRFLCAGDGTAQSMGEAKF
jgi:hypothetical protein